jgi:uncharacterized membrane protein
MKGALQWTAVGSLLGLIALCLAWELWLAPLRPGGSALAFKAIPLLLPLFGLLRGRRYTYQWAWTFGLAYFTEGVVRGWSDRGLSQQLAFAEVALSLLLFVATVLYARVSGRG